MRLTFFLQNVSRVFALALAIGSFQPLNAASPKKEALPQIAVSPQRGFQDAPITVKLTPPNDAVLRYTLDGTEPAPANGVEYAAPFSITNTTLLRVAAFKGKARASAVTTHSYIFLDQIMHQSKKPPGLPAGPTAWNGLPSAYQMEPRVVNSPAYSNRMRGAFQSLPVASIVCSRDDLFGPRGLYLNTTQRGAEWERACSAEMILPDGKTAFQIDCGIRIQGAMNRVPDRSPKHSFRLLFKEQYGASKLRYRVFPDSPVNKFDTLVLRADYNNSWVHWDGRAQPRAQRIRDAWMKDSQRAMGWVAPHNRYVHLFLNGLYWGVYDFTERPDSSFAAAYFGGASEDYDVINEFQAKGGTLEAFTQLRSLQGLARDDAYRKLTQLLNITEYIDYLLLNHYGANQDWGENKNWYAIRRRSPAAPFQYVVWDGEQVLQDLHDDTLANPYETPFRIAEELRGNAEFCLAFADRVQKHCFGEGALTPEACAARWMKRAREVDEAIVAESARWGYYRRSQPFTRDKEWLAEQQRLMKNYFPQRTGIVLEQLRTAGLYPKIAAPALHQSKSAKDETVSLTINASGKGAIYYTTNGLDPRVAFTGAADGHALKYSTALTLASPVTLKARVLESGLWSALVETSFTNSGGRH